MGQRLEIDGIKEATKELSQEAGINSVTGKFIFNENEVVKYVPFTIQKFNNIFGYGFMLPKEVPLFTGKGKNRQLVGQHQIRSPAVLTSEKELIEPSLSTEKQFKIKYIAIPTELKLRLDLKVIEDFVKGKASIPSGIELFDKIKKTYEKFLFFQNPVWYEVHTLWDIGTYFFELFNTFPILELRGLSGTAKSKVMEVSKLFTLNPTEIMVNPSEASLFRITHTNRPTKYIDEAEKLFQFINGAFQSSPVVELINGSYSKGSSVPRLEKDGNQYKMVYYGCYSPTMVGSIAGLREATETRAITHITTKAGDKDSRGELEVKDYESDLDFQLIRNELYLFALSNWKEIEKTYFELKVEKLKKRDFQIWKPLLAIAKVLDKSLYERVLAFAEKVSEQRKQDFIPEGSLDFRILKIVNALLEINQDKVYVNDVTERLNSNVASENKIAQKTISSHLDKIGFKEYRTRDMNGSVFEINKQIYEIVVSPICPSLV